jgi:small subunit ribosomal protein S7
MSRSKVDFVAKGNTAQIEKFINYIMLDGKKTVARRNLNDTFELIKKKTGENPRQVFEKALQEAQPSMEVRAKRIGGSVYQIPMQVKPFRQFQLASRWILAAARSQKGTTFAQALANIIMQTANGEGPAIKKKEDVHRMAQANKAFAHFARY